MCEARGNALGSGDEDDRLYSGLLGHKQEKFYYLENNL